MRLSLAALLLLLGPADKAMAQRATDFSGYDVKLKVIEKDAQGASRILFDEKHLFDKGSTGEWYVHSSLYRYDAKLERHGNSLHLLRLTLTAEAEIGATPNRITRCYFDACAEPSEHYRIVRKNEGGSLTLEFEFHPPNP